MSNGPNSGETFVSGIRYYRKKNHMTQIDLAEDSNFCQSVGKW